MVLVGAGPCHLSEPEQLVLDGVCQLLQERLHGVMQQPDACCAALCAGKVPARAKGHQQRRVASRAARSELTAVRRNVCQSLCGR
jgi:hypothetical protein